MNVTYTDAVSEILKINSEYSNAVTAAMKSAASKTSEWAEKELKATSPRRSGAYAKSWKAKTVFENTRSKRETVYNAKHYRLTHLLENGHASRNGSRVRAQVHIYSVNEKAAVMFEREFINEIEQNS